MMNIKLYNKISSKGLNLFTDQYHVDVDVDHPDAILVRSAKLHDIELNDELKAIARAGAGVNNIPIDKCSEKGIVVFNTPGANANAVKELVIAGLLISSRPVYEAMKWLDSVKDQDGIAELAEKEKSKFTGVELEGKALGVIGLGAIGIRVANAALHLGMEVYGYDPYLSVDSAWQLSRRVKLVKSVEEVYKHSDYITLHVPMNDSTKNMIDKNAIKLMKNGVVLLNYARGGLVQEDDMIEAMNAGKVRKYVSDFASNKMMKQKDYICTPHLGASTPEAEENCAVMAVHQLMDYLENGNIKNSVNLPNVSMERSGEIRITCFHLNAPNILAQISQAISKAGLNIENMINKSKKEYAYTMIDIDQADIDEVIETLKKIPEIQRVQVYR